MKSANGVPFAYLFDLFAKGENVDETSFCFKGESGFSERCLGYLPEGPIPDNPYWAGNCDFPDGFGCATAEELLNAPIYTGKSLKERWHEAIILDIGALDASDFISTYSDQYPIENYS